MDARLINPFLEALFEVLPAVGLTDIRRGRLALKDKLLATMEVTALVGLSGEIRGNVIYCMSVGTAEKIASAMMMGMPVDHFDEMAQSAVSELANMMASNASVSLSRNHKVSISPPTLIVGENITAMVSQVRTITFEVITGAGLIEVNLGLEV